MVFLVVYSVKWNLVATRVAPPDLWECKPNLDGSTPRPCRSILLLSWYFLGVDINCCHSHTDRTQVPFIIYRGRIRNCRRVPPPSYVNVSPFIKWWYVQHTWNLAWKNFDVILGEEKQVLSASSGLCGRALYHRVHNYASRQTAGSQQSVQTLV